MNNSEVKSDEREVTGICEAATFEQTRDACALLARSTAFAQLTVRHKVDPETAVAVSTELYLTVKSLTIDQVEQEKRS